MTQLSILQTINVLVSAFDERQKSLENCFMQADTQEGHDDISWVTRLDALILQILHRLNDYPVEKWLSLCEAMEPNAILISAASHCKGFAIGDIDRYFQQVLPGENFSGVLPYNAHHNAARFFNHDILQTKSNQSLPSLDDLLTYNISRNALAFLLSTQGNKPAFIENERLKFLYSDLAVFVAYHWACAGFPDERSKILEYWWYNENNSPMARFWSGFALILRNASWHDKIDDLVNIANDPITRTFAAHLKRSIEDGSLQSNEALELVDIVAEGSVLLALRHAIRLAMWSPQQMALIEAGCLESHQTQQITRLKDNIKRASLDGADFYPERYQPKSIQNNPITSIALSREEILGQGQLRGWIPQDIEQTLQQKAVPIMTGEYFVHFHPQTGAGLVTMADTSAIIHLGRPGYVYSFQSLTYNARQLTLSLPAPLHEGCEWVLIPLKYERIHVWRPVEARRMHNDLFCIMPQQNKPKDEHWLYPPTAYVICGHQSFIGGSFLAATKAGPVRI